MTRKTGRSRAAARAPGKARRPVDPTHVRLAVLAVYLVLVVVMVLVADPALASTSSGGVAVGRNVPTVVFTAVVVGALVVRSIRLRGRLPRTRMPRPRSAPDHHVAR